MCPGADLGMYCCEPSHLIGLSISHLLGRDDGNLGFAFLAGIGGTTGFYLSGGDASLVASGAGIASSGA